MATRKPNKGGKGLPETREVLLKLTPKVCALLDEVTGLLLAATAGEGKKFRSDAVALAVTLLHKRLSGRPDILKRILRGQAELLLEDEPGDLPGCDKAGDGLAGDNGEMRLGA